MSDTELTEWEIEGRRAAHECRDQLTKGACDVHRILDILERAGA